MLTGSRGIHRGKICLTDHDGVSGEDLNVERTEVGSRFWLRWVSATIAGWAVGFSVVSGVVLVEPVVGGGSVRFAIYGAVLGAVFGVITGTALVWLLRQPVPEAISEAGRSGT